MVTFELVFIIALTAFSLSRWGVAFSFYVLIFFHTLAKRAIISSP